MNLQEVRKIMRGGRGIVEGMEIDEIFRGAKASWVYQGLKHEPHALLTSGKHSDGYFNLNAVTQFSNLLEELAERLVDKVDEKIGAMTTIDAVVSSSFAAITFGAEVARQLNAMFVFTEKKRKEQVWSGRFELPSGARILQVEELITTLSTTRKVREAILQANPEVKFLEKDSKTLVATIIHRPEKLEDYLDYEVMALKEIEIHNWQPEKCPLCKKGSKALKPKPNWQEFQRFMRMKK